MSDNQPNNQSGDPLKSAATDLLAAITNVINAGASAIESLAGESVRGSGVVVDRTYDLTGFTAVAIGSAFMGEVRRGDGWQVVVTADDNIIDKVSVTLEGKALHVKMNGWHVSATKLRVAITMPAIEELSVGGASNVTIADFARAPAFTARLSGASKLSGFISADTLTVSAGGASSLDLEGAGSTLTLNVSGASHVRLGKLPVETVKAALSGASHAHVNATHTIALAASGASHLRYGGGANVVSSQLSGGSSAARA